MRTTLKDGLGFFLALLSQQGLHTLPPAIMLTSSSDSQGVRSRQEKEKFPGR